MNKKKVQAPQLREVKDEEENQPFTDAEIKQMEKLKAQFDALTDEQRRAMMPDNMLEIPLLNAHIDVTDTEVPGAEGKGTAQGKLVTVIAMMGIAVGGVITQPRPVRFVMPLTEEGATSLSEALSKSGLIVVGADKMPPSPVIIP